MRAGIVALAATAVAVFGAYTPTARSDVPTLVADVGANDGYGISLMTAAGEPVTHLDPGTYTILVHDHSRIHDFHLIGPGVDKATAVLGRGDFSWTVTLVDGNYRFQCDPHVTAMHGSFTVGNAVPAPGRLSATIAASGTLSLKDDWNKRVTRLPENRYIVTVRDGTRSDSFRLIGPQINRATGVRFIGTIRWTITLRPGSYIYRCDRHRRSRGSFSVVAVASSH